MRTRRMQARSSSFPYTPFPNQLILSTDNGIFSIAGREATLLLNGAPPSSPYYIDLTPASLTGGSPFWPDAKGNANFDTSEGSPTVTPNLISTFSGVTFSGPDALRSIFMETSPSYTALVVARYTGDITVGFAGLIGNSDTASGGFLIAVATSMIYFEAFAGGAQQIVYSSLAPDDGWYVYGIQALANGNWNVVFNGSIIPCGPLGVANPAAEALTLGTAVPDHAGLGFDWEGDVLHTRYITGAASEDLDLSAEVTKLENLYGI